MTTLDEQLKAMGEACIDNTPRQVESLAIDVGELTVSDKWNAEGLPPIGVECEFAEVYLDDWERCIIYGMYGGYFACAWGEGLKENDSFLIDSFKFRKLESPQEKAKRERDEQARLLLIDLCGDDVFKDRDWEYHKKFTHSAELAFRLVDKKWRKGE